MSNPFEVLKVEGEGSGTPAAFDEKVAEEEQVDVSPARPLVAMDDRRTETHAVDAWRSTTLVRPTVAKGGQTG